MKLGKYTKIQEKKRTLLTRAQRLNICFIWNDDFLFILKIDKNFNFKKLIEIASVNCWVLLSVLVKWFNKESSIYYVRKIFQKLTFFPRNT